MTSCDVHHSSEVMFRGDVSCWVVRKIYDNELRVGSNIFFQKLRIKSPPLFLVGFPPCQLTSYRQGDFVQRLIPRPGADDVVALLEHGAHGEQDSLCGNCEQHAIERYALVESGNLFAQKWQIERFGIAKFQPIP